ncbi:MAG: hypothetical protein MZV63_22155 [Marinilabiliales bacterium]|nr:hypothetical protein [Marinilabiliales bacterium]
MLIALLAYCSPLIRMALKKAGLRQGQHQRRISVNRPARWDDRRVAPPYPIPSAPGTTIGPSVAGRSGPRRISPHAD